MPVHAQVETVLGLIEKSGNPEFHELSPQEARAVRGESPNPRCEAHRGASR